MPTTPYIRILTSVNADVPALGAREVVNGDTIAFTFESQVAWPSDTTARLEFYSYPDGWAGPGAPWVTESVSVVYNGSTITYDAFVYTGNSAPPSFTAPAGPAWGKYCLSAKLGNGQKNGVASSDMYDESTGFEILSPEGLRDLAWRESATFAEDRPWTKWVEDVRKNAVAIDAGLAAAAPVVTLTAGAGLTGGGTTAANRTFDVGAGDGITVNTNDVAVTWGAVGEMAAAANANGAGVATKSARIDHTHAISAASGGAAGTMSAAHYTRVNDAATAATVSTLGLRGASGELSVGYLYSAGTVSTTGFVRCTSTATFVAFRDFADTMDIPALHTDGSDRIFLGSGVAACDGVTLDANGATGRHDLSIDGSALVSVGPTETVAYSDVKVVGLKTAATGAAITGAATLDTTQSTVYVDAAGGSFSLALPAAAGVAGRIWTIVKITAANTVTLDADGTEKINGALTYAITTQWSAITIQAVNQPAISEWIVIATA